jgi:ABC-type branched-subunit amino acid transport system permease subunit
VLQHTAWALFASEKDAFPFAAIAMALTASVCTVLISIPAVKKSVLSLAIVTQVDANYFCYILN